jgi:hypothetical protein
MQGPDLYRKFRSLIEELADEPLSLELSLTRLHVLLEQFALDATALEVPKANFVCEEIADQLEHEALRCTSRHRRDVLLAAVKGFDSMAFPKSKP